MAAECPDCHGLCHTGEVIKTIPSYGHGESKVYRPCTTCKGTGEVKDG